MIKKICLGLCLFIFSCTTTNNLNTNQNIDQIVVNTNNDLWNGVTYSKFSNLETVFKENNEFTFQGGYNNDDNVFMIFFNKTSYLIDSNLNISSNKLIEKEGKIFSNPILDKTGNGIGFYSGETGTGFETERHIKRFEKFVPKEDLSVINNDYNFPQLINMINNDIGKGYSIYNNNHKDLTLFDIKINNGFFEHSISNSFTLKTDEKFSYVISSDINKALVFTQDKNNILRVYNLDNNKIDLNKGKVLDFTFIKYSNHLSGNINLKGNGYIQAYDGNSNYELKKIENFEIKNESYLIDVSPLIRLDSNGSGLIISVKEGNIYFNEVDKFKIIKSEYITKSEYPDVNYQINNKGNGFILISKYIKTLYSENKVSSVFDNKFILVKNYKMVNKN